MLAACSRKDPQPTVTLYTSSDAFIAQPIIKAFEQKSGIKVNMVGDTEATKTTGLTERLIAEMGKPMCDVWWSNEMLGTVQLAALNVLDPFTPAAAKTDFAGTWPAAYADPQGRWHGHALRWRVIAYNTNRIKAADAPRTLQELILPRYKGAVGMARPQFGTTRSQITMMVALHGEKAVSDWITLMLANGVRLYDGNSAVVQALGHGEIEVGLTDTDDALQGKANKWPVDFVAEAVLPVSPSALPSVGPLAIPNTVALVKGRPHPREAQQLADYLLSAAAEEALARSEAHTVPIRESLRNSFKALDMPDAFAPVSPDQLSAAQTAADRLIKTRFGVR